MEFWPYLVHALDETLAKDRCLSKAIVQYHLFSQLSDDYEEEEK